MSDIGSRVSQSLATMNYEERRAYSKGLSNAYGDVFKTFAEAFTSSQADLHTVFTKIKADWDDVRNKQEGVL
jgi:hypothetical protein